MNLLGFSMRWTCIPSLALLACLAGVGCDSPELVDCAPATAPARDQGRFVRLPGGVWCVYGERGNADCPSTLPERHTLPWGGYGCAEERFEPLPGDLCVALDECSDDVGGDGGR